MNGEKMALRGWQGSAEHHEIGIALFADLERRGLVLSKRILFVTDGASGLLKALRERFGKKLVNQLGFWLLVACASFSPVRMSAR